MALDGKVAVVYAGARGIGRAYCEALLQKGCKVYFGDILQQEGADTKQEFQEKYKNSEISFKKCDVLIESDVKDLMSQAIAAHGAIDIVIANAGIVAEKQWQRCIDLNVAGTMRVYYTAMEHMSKTNGGKGGCFIVTSSLAGIKPALAMPVYTATKHCIVGFIRAWGTAENYQLTGIKCNAVCPHVVETNFTTDTNQDPFLFKEHGEHMVKGVQEAYMNSQVLRPNDVGQSLIKLLEDEAANGQCLEVSKQGNVYFPFQEKAI